MWHKLRSTISSENHWVEQDRVEMGKLIATATLFLVAVVSGVGLLVYALATA